MKHLSQVLIFIVSLTFILPSCDPEFILTPTTCFALAFCAGSAEPAWEWDSWVTDPSDPEATGKCLCNCHQVPTFPISEQTGPCGKRCEYRVEDCVGGWSIGTDGDCKCFCPSGFMNPPLCQIKRGNFQKLAFHSSQNPNARQVVDKADYFPLWEGNYWEYDAYDSTGMEVVSKFAYAVTDTFTLDTLDTILIYAYDYIFFDTLGMPNDTTLGSMLYNFPADSNQVIAYPDSNDVFMFHNFTFGDTLFMDGPDYTVADSIGTITVAAGTFDQCIWLRNQDSSGQVFAPYIGMIQVRIENIKALELAEYYLPCEFSIQIDTFNASGCNSNDGSIVVYTYGNNANLTYTWDGPTAIGDIPNPNNLGAGYYAVTVSNTDCSTMIDSIPVAGCANLPIELLSFTAKAFDQNVVLKWSTSTEINNEYFQLEFSTDGKSFSPISRIEGAGTSYRKTDYTYLHTQPVKGINFYRLKQVDFGGLYEYSDVVSVSIAQTQFSFYPNPAKDRIQLICPSESFEVRLMRHDGTFIKKKKMNSGDYLDISGIAAGLYLMQLEEEGMREVHPLMIVAY